MQLPINRQISSWITPWLAFFQLTPNQVTLLSLGAGFLSAWNFFQGMPRTWLLGAVWLEIAYVLDNCDGELARLTGTSSGLCSWLDTITDCLIHMTFFLCLGFGLYRFHSNPLWIHLGWISAGGVFLTYVTFILDQIRQRGKEALIHPDPPSGEGPPGLLGKVRKVFREDFSLVVLGSALLGHVAWLLWGGVFGAFIYWISNTVVLATREWR